jgi:flagellar biogenesis protein FliO
MGLRIIPAIFLFCLLPLKPMAADSTAAKTFDMEKLRSELLSANSGASPADSVKYRSSGSKEAIMVTLKVMFYIGLISVILYYAIRIIKSGAAGRGWSKRLGGRSIEVLESVSMGGNKTISLVKIADRVLLLGVSEKEINALADFREKESVAAIMKTNGDSSQAVASGFSQTVNSFLGRLRKEGPRPLSTIQDPQA